MVSQCVDRPISRLRLRGSFGNLDRSFRRWEFSVRRRFRGQSDGRCRHRRPTGGSHHQSRIQPAQRTTRKAGSIVRERKNNASVRIVNETTGSVITSWAPLDLFESLLDVSPNGSELLVHIRAWPVWMFRYSVENDNPVLLASTSQYLGQADQVIVDWAARIVYLSSFDKYGIKLISLDTLGAIRDLVTDAYPAGIALLADQHLAFALNDFSAYRSGLWAFNTSTNNLVREIPIGSELQFVVASPSTQTVLVWTPYGVRIFPLAPAVTPSDPPPGASLTYLPPAVTAVVWGGIPEVTVDGKQVSVNGVALFSRLQLPQNVLVGFVSPPIQVGTWN